MVDVWKEILMYMVKNRKGKFAIYPFGNNGVRIKHFLNDTLGILEDLRIDSKYSQFTDYVISIEMLKKIDRYQEYIYIISSAAYCFAQELLKQGIPEANIVFCNPDYVLYTNKYGAYYDAVYYLIRKYKPHSIYDVDCFFGGGQIGRNLYSEIDSREECLFDIILYADRDKIMKLFPAQKKIYREICNSCPDMILCVDDFSVSSKVLAETLEYKTIAVISKVPIMELKGFVNYMYSYLYIYVLEEGGIYGG